LGRAQRDPAHFLVDVTAQSNATRLAPDAKRQRRIAGAPPDLMRLMYTSGNHRSAEGCDADLRNIHWKSWIMCWRSASAAIRELLVAGPLYHVGALDLPGIACCGRAESSAFQRDSIRRSACGDRSDRLMGLGLRRQ